MDGARRKRGLQIKRWISQQQILVCHRVHSSPANHQTWPLNPHNQPTARSVTCLNIIHDHHHQRYQSYHISIIVIIRWPAWPPYHPHHLLQLRPHCSEPLLLLHLLLLLLLLLLVQLTCQLPPNPHHQEKSQASCLILFEYFASLINSAIC